MLFPTLRLQCALVVVCTSLRAATLSLVNVHACVGCERATQCGQLVWREKTLCTVKKIENNIIVVVVVNSDPTSNTLAIYYATTTHGRESTNDFLILVTISLYIFSLIFLVLKTHYYNVEYNTWNTVQYDGALSSNQRKVNTPMNVQMSSSALFFGGWRTRTLRETRTVE